MPKNGNVNFNFKLMRGRHLIVEQKIAIPLENLRPFAAIKIENGKAVPDNVTQETLENVAAGIMYEVERAINSDTGFPMRCHIEQLPSDIPSDMKLEE